MNRGVLIGLSAYVLWGLSPIYWKLVDDIPAGDIIPFRIAATALVLLLLHVGGKSIARLRAVARDRATSRVMVITAALLACNWVLFVWSINDDRVLEVSLGYFMNPLMNVVLGVLVLRERLRVLQWAAVGLAAVGVGILTVDVGRLPWVSLVLAVTFALYGLLRKTSPAGSLDGLTLEVGIMLPIALGVIVVRAAMGDGVVGVSVPGRDLFFLGAGVVTAGPLLLFATAARRIPLSLLGILQYVAPTMQFILGVVIYNEEWSGGQVVGYCVIWVALFIFAVESIVTARRASVRRSDPTRQGR